MKIIEANEKFKRINGKLQFNRMGGIVEHEGDVYIAEWTDRFSSPSHFSDFEKVVKLELEDRGPLIKPAWTPAPQLDYFVKKPSLFAFAGPVENLILREIEAYELLLQNPHPNMVNYYGYRAVRGRVSGLCLEQCVSTLAGKVNPRALNKSEFVSSGRSLVDDTLRVEGIESAVAHLHSLGLVHNDINPSNIFITRDGRLALGDFDSCRRAGESLTNGSEGTKRTYGWHDPSVTVALRRNDLDAIEELRTWMFGSSADEFIFH